MTKILLVEDDNSLREIYGARLEAEGYEIVAAADGEKALSLALKERPDLIISDVMMPKVSGFDVVDILRQTPETKDTKIILMTALSQEEDKLRGEQLGADDYLIKSQVTLEDVVNKVTEVLARPPRGQAAPAVNNPNPVSNSAPAPMAATPTAPTSPQPTTPAPAPVAATPDPSPVIPTTPPATPELVNSGIAPTPDPVAATATASPADPVSTPVAAPTVDPTPPATVTTPPDPVPEPVVPTPAPTVTTAPDTPTDASLEPTAPPTPKLADTPSPLTQAGNKVISPLNDLSKPTLDPAVIKAELEGTPDASSMPGVVGASVIEPSAQPSASVGAPDAAVSSQPDQSSATPGNVINPSVAP